MSYITTRQPLGALASVPWGKYSPAPEVPSASVVIKEPLPDEVTIPYPDSTTSDRLLAPVLKGALSATFLVGEYTAGGAMVPPPTFAIKSLMLWLLAW